MGAESAAALAGLSQRSDVASLLCTQDAFCKFKELLQSDQTNVAIPLARMLLCLAQRPESKVQFSDRELLELVLAKVQSNAASTLVQEQYAQVFSSAASLCASALAKESVEEVLASLSKAMEKVLLQSNSSPYESPSCAATYRNLQDAHAAFKYQHYFADTW